MSGTYAFAGVEQEIVEREGEWAAAIQSQGRERAGRFLEEGCFLGKAVQGLPLQVVPKDSWPETLKVYVT